MTPLVRNFLGTAIALGVAVGGIFVAHSANIPGRWKEQWPDTDFSKISVDPDSIFSGGPPRDGIPPIDRPKFAPAGEIDGLVETEPVITVEINGIAKAYPLRVMMWHEIVNDRIGNVPVAVTYCPLCDAAIVFDRRVDDTVLDFGTTGKLRNSDLVMWDRQTESWWQQFTGEAIVGGMTGTRLRMLPSRVESWARYRDRHPDGLVLLPDRIGRNYGRNPYENYDDPDSRPWRFYEGKYPRNIAPMARVVKVGGEAFALDLLQKHGRIETETHVLEWQPGQNSALDDRFIPDGRDIGNVVVWRKSDDELKEAVHDVTFAFAFHAFHPEAPIHTALPDSASSPSP